MDNRYRKSAIVTPGEEAGARGALRKVTLATIAESVIGAPPGNDASRRLFSLSRCLAMTDWTRPGRSCAVLTTAMLRACPPDLRLYPQARLAHQRHHGFAEELKIRCEIEEGDLDPVATGPLELNQLVNHVLRAADDLNIAAECAVCVSVCLPRHGIASPLVRDKAFDCALIGRIKDGLMVAPGLAIGLATNDHRIDDRAKLPAAFGAGGFDPGIMRRQRGKRGVDLMAGWARDEDEVGMRRSVAMPAGEPVAFTSTGRPNRGFGVMNAFSSDQNLPCSVKSSEAPQSRQSMSVNSPAMS